MNDDAGMRILRHPLVPERDDRYQARVVVRLRRGAWISGALRIALAMAASIGALAVVELARFVFGLAVMTRVLGGYEALVILTLCGGALVIAWLCAES